MRCATAFFITRALLTTWGRNIFPEPNRSPTTFIPRMSGPSITSIGRVTRPRASSVSCTTQVSIPSTSACASRSSTGSARHSASGFSIRAPVPLYRSAISSNRSVASGRRFWTTSSTRSSRSFGMSS